MKGLSSMPLTVMVLLVHFHLAYLRSQSPNVMLGKSPERDREIEVVQNIIRWCGEVGIPSVKYNMNIIGIPRSEREEGRGGSSNSTFRWAKMDQDAPPTIAGVVGVEENWERIAYFLNRAVPAAESAKVRLACHPHDPYTPGGRADWFHGRESYKANLHGSLGPNRTCRSRLLYRRRNASGHDLRRCGA